MACAAFMIWQLPYSLTLLPDSHVRTRVYVEWINVHMQAWETETLCFGWALFLSSHLSAPEHLAKPLS